MEQSSRVRVSGPLAGCAPELISYLAKRGYTDHSVTNHLRRLACLSRWMEARALERAGVDEALIAKMLEALHATGEARSFTPCSFALVLGFLRAHALVPAAPIVAPTPIEELLGDYRCYLVAERSLAPLSLPGYLASAAWFLSDACDDDPDRVADLSARDVASFVLRVAEVRSPASVNTVVVGVRSLLRWFYAKAMTATPLAQATPWLARGAMCTLPRSLGAGHASALLATPDRHLLSGLRDIAVLTVLVRLGLRAGEVAAMELDDIDWRRGELNVRSKGGWRDPLPLPVDVGEALVDYLSARGERGEHRHVFAHVRDREDR